MGPNYSISTACATSNFCILNAANHIIRGETVSIILRLSRFSVIYIQTHGLDSMGENLQDMMLSGGSDSAIIPIGIGEVELLIISS